MLGDYRSQGFIADSTSVADDLPSLVVVSRTVITECHKDMNLLTTFRSFMGNAPPLSTDDDMSFMLFVLQTLIVFHRFAECAMCII